MRYLTVFVASFIVTVVIDYFSHILLKKEDNFFSTENMIEEFFRTFKILIIVLILTR